MEVILHDPSTSQTDQERAEALANERTTDELVEEYRRYDEECGRADRVTSLSVLIGAFAVTVGFLKPFGISWSFMGPIIGLIAAILLISLRIRTWVRWNRRIHADALLIKGRGPTPPRAPRPPS